MPYNRKRPIEEFSVVPMILGALAIAAVLVVVALVVISIKSRGEFKSGPSRDDDPAAEARAEGNTVNPVVTFRT